MNKSQKILVFATKGKNTNEEQRIVALFDRFEVDIFGFDYDRKFNSFWRLLKRDWAETPQLIVMEGTGMAGGFACLILSWFFNIPYVVSSGDAVAPFISMKFNRIFGWIAQLYEQMLCRFCIGFIGWTPYLVGRALTFGAPRGMTAAGWSIEKYSRDRLAQSRQATRAQLGIPQDAIVYGLVGSLAWVEKIKYCYGIELVKARQRLPPNANVWIIIVGDGLGTPHLKTVAGDLLGTKIFLTGNIPNNQIFEYLAAMDVASLPQSVDGVGSFRYTTKVSEYLATELPIMTSQIPMAYDLIADWSWCLPGAHPWEDRYISEVAKLMSTLSPDQIATKRQHIPAEIPEFNLQYQQEKVTKFIEGILLP